MRFLVLLLPLFVGFCASSSVKISPELLAEAQTGVVKDVIISFGSIPSRIYSSISKTKNANAAYEITTSLQHHSSLMQSEVLAYLESQGAKYKQLWITNQIAVKDCSLSLMLGISEIQAVTGLSEDFLIPLEDDLDRNQNERIEKPRKAGKPMQSDNQWGIEMIKAPDAQALLNQQASQRSRVRVAIVDTGIRASHEAIGHNFIQEYGWYDPINEAQEPYDDNGHGTHVAGTIGGKFGIGVFPDAELMACKGCGTSCPSSALIACGQFAVCPHFPDGSNANCSYVANVVSNSWNGGQGQVWFNPVIEAWHTAGIIPVFSAGNNGPMCSTISSPADGNVISVGASTNIDSVIYFSSVGPSFFGDIKPDVVAPGYEILSAWPAGDDTYSVASGTSMACPHVSGLVALLLSYKPDLTYQEVLTFLTTTAETASLVESGRTCGGIPGTQFPNNDYGHGRVNALDALNAVINAFPPVTEPPTTTTTEAPTTTTTTEEPTTTTTTEKTTTTRAPPTGPCPHGPFWHPDETNVPNLICVCQETSCSGFAYNCLTAAVPN